MSIRRQSDDSQSDVGESASVQFYYLAEKGVNLMWRSFVGNCAKLYFALHNLISMFLDFTLMEHIHPMSFYFCIIGMAVISLTFKIYPIVVPV
jgi:hypothetical protein